MFPTRILTYNIIIHSLVSKNILTQSQTMAALTISCGTPSRSSSGVTKLGAWSHKFSVPAKKDGGWTKVKAKNLRSKKVQPRTRSPAFPAIGNAVAHKATGSWGKKLKVSNMDTVRGTGTVIRCGFKKREPVKKLTRSCAYCHDEENIHHIRDCPVLAAKNRARAEAKKKQKQEMRAAQLEQAEAMLAAKFAPHPVDEAINRGHVSVRSKPKKVDLKDNRFNGLDDDEDFKPRRRVSFKGDDVDTLMKPPCETKIFDTDAPASSVSSDEDAQVYPDEEEYLLRKRSKTAWKPKFQMTAHELQIGAEKKVKKKSWADMCDDDSDDEDDFDQFGRPTTDNSAW